MKCPGTDTRYWKESDIFEVPCPKCKNLIESLKSHQRKHKDDIEARRTKYTHSATSLEFFCVKEFPALPVSAIIYSKDPEPRKKERLSMQFSRNRRSIIWNP